ncbi:MAG: MFS transporter [Nanoarchaeota archaeon]|nr:MFS transporter [Nanoarchaeota archaeon]
MQKLNNELTEVYLTLYLRKFAITLAGVFIPIYLHTIGYNLNEVLFAVAIMYAAKAFLAPVALKVSEKIGVKHTIVFNVPALLLFFYFLYLLPDHPHYFGYLVAPFIAMSNVMFWIPTNGIFARFSHKKKTGKETSYLILTSRLSGVLAPLVGGIILTELSFNYLFAIVGGILTLSLVPLFLSRDYSCKRKDVGMKIVREHTKYYFAYFVQGILAATTFLVIPFLTLFLLKSYLSVGSVSTLLLVGSFFVIFVVGKLTDKFEGKHLIKLGGAVLSVSFLILAYAKSPLVVYSASFLVGIGIIMAFLPIFAISSIIAKKYNETEFMMLREIFIAAGSTFMVLLLVPFPDVVKIKVGLLVAALASTYFVLMK